MRPKVLLGVAVLGAIAVTATLAVVARTPSVLDRLRAVPADFTAAYRRREAELRTALLPDDDAVAAARADVARRRADGRRFADGRRIAGVDGATGADATDPDETDDLPYSFY
ncbi:hypothetical protein [Georgenia yuyongxinii]|uniref:Uncharacterized protein n=1 Tax=Georgenia yuyongxinii TaxID=2589797 RepID=A0A552WXW2_9MICO|nr:hypothetical protein [Georgenia yuyongxinii]TRW47506.1 hypothetical protein FJ693_01555 [Georgenia yuyongxinii]